MSVSHKDFYFLTNRSTLFRYFVDNSSGKPHRYLFYPKKYQTMTDRQIIKFEQKLTRKFLWWGLWNRQKMYPNDYKICLSKALDYGVIFLSTFLLARFTRVFLFKQPLISLQNFFQNRNMDAKFWKALSAYTVSFGIGFTFAFNMKNDVSTTDLAFEYAPNYNKQVEMPEIQNKMQSLYLKRFPWLSQEKNDKK